MFGFCCKRLQLLVVPSYSIAVESSVARLHCNSQFSRSYSSKSLLDSEIDKPQEEEQDGSFTVSHLINSCGLSPELALSLSQKVHLKTREKPDSVIKLLKSYGFNDTYISQLVRKRPNVLRANPEKTLLPKLEFLSSIGLSGIDIVQVLCRKPTILKRNIDRSLRPCYDIIKSLHLPDIKLAVFFKHYWNVTVKVLSNIVCNVAVIRQLNVSESLISFYVAYHPPAMSLENDKFNKTVKRVMSMGIHPSSTASTFMKALHMISTTDSSKWAQKMEFYRKCGWTEDDFLVAFRKNPMFMQLTEKNISRKMDFIVNRMALVQPADLACNPTVLTYSLENWIIPRCPVTKVLLWKGLIKKGEFSLHTMMGQSKKKFLARFVVQYQEQVPELLSIFEGKMGLAELGLGFEERGGVK